MFYVEQDYKVTLLSYYHRTLHNLKHISIPNHKIKRRITRNFKKEVHHLLTKSNVLEKTTGVGYAKQAARQAVTIAIKKAFSAVNEKVLIPVLHGRDDVSYKTAYLYDTWRGNLLHQEQHLQNVLAVQQPQEHWSLAEYAQLTYKKRRFRKKKETLPANFWQLTYKSNVGEGFFFSLTTPRTYVSHRKIRFAGWSAGNNAVVTKAARRSVKNILSWWNYIFSDVLYALFFDIYDEEHNMLLFYFKSMNNLTIRYFFMNHLYVKNINYVQSLYFIRYNFFQKLVLKKKARYMKKFKKKGLVHADRFSRREFWIVSKR